MLKTNTIMRITIIITILALVCCPSNMYAQKLKNTKPNDTVTTTTWELLKHDAKTAFKGATHSFTRPLHWKKKDFTTLGVMLVGTVAMSAIDDEANRFFTRQEPHVPKLIKQFGWYFGSPQNYFAATAGIYGFGLFTKNEQVRKTGVLIITSSFTTGLLQSISKNVTGRARPSANIGSASFDPFSKESKFHSFPSGHTILSITMAHSIAKQFDNTWAKIGIYSIGSIPPISRLLEGEHWLTDVAFSAALSIIVVDGIDKFLFNSNAYSYPKRKKAISWNLKLSGNQIGVVGTF